MKKKTKPIRIAKDKDISGAAVDITDGTWTPPGLSVDDNDQLKQIEPRWIFSHESRLGCPECRKRERNGKYKP